MRQYISKTNRALLAELVRTDFKLRYQGSVLGYAWSLLRPLLLFIIMYIVFGRFLKIGSNIPHYTIYLLVGIVVWNFFMEMTTQSLGSIVARGDLIRKIRIPRWLIIVASSLAALINLGLNIIVVIIFMVIGRVGGLGTLPLVVPLIIEVYLVSLGVSLFLSALFVKFRDVNYIWEVVIQAGFYATPIFYPLNRIHSLLFQKILMINPLAQAIQDIRYSSVTHQSQTIYQVFGGSIYIFVPFVISALVLAGGVAYFKKHANHFAEDI